MGALFPFLAVRDTDAAAAFYVEAFGATVSGFAALAMIAAASSGWMGWRITRTPELASDSALPERT